MNVDSKIIFPLTVPALRVDQPMGVYYVTVLPAQVLLKLCFSDRLRIAGQTDSSYSLEGNQRRLDEKRLRTIADYIDRTDSAFPNSIILAANSRSDDNLIEEEGPQRWTVSENGSGIHVISIPTEAKLAAIIDGQHRLGAFEFADPKNLAMPLVCSIFFDLNKPFQAQLFATINSTQKPVDRSLTYELFGYNILEEPESSWSPDKLAVFLSRKLNTDIDSPLRSRIAIAPEGDLKLSDERYDQQWHVSMATVVDGIVKLYSTNPKSDANELLKTMPPLERSSLRNTRPNDRSPLRPLYLENNDLVVYSIVKNFLSACKVTFWERATPGSFIVKTVGIQAMFDVLRRLAPDILVTKMATTDHFLKTLQPAENIDFSEDQFKNASGSGRGMIKNAILEALNMTA
jgi:DNA phosphorothioation-associated DGQHR protein 1